MPRGKRTVSRRRKEGKNDTLDVTVPSMRTVNRPMSAVRSRRDNQRNSSSQERPASARAPSKSRGPFDASSVPHRGRMRPSSRRNANVAKVKQFDFLGGIPTQAHEEERQSLTAEEAEFKALRESWGKRQVDDHSWNRSLSSSRNRPHTARSRIRPQTASRQRPVSARGRGRGGQVKSFRSVRPSTARVRRSTDRSSGSHSNLFGRRVQNSSSTSAKRRGRGGGIRPYRASAEEVTSSAQKQELQHTFEEKMASLGLDIGGKGSSLARSHRASLSKSTKLVQSRPLVNEPNISKTEIPQNKLAHSYELEENRWSDLRKAKKSEKENVERMYADERVRDLRNAENDTQEEDSLADLNMNKTASPSYKVRVDNLEAAIDKARGEANVGNFDTIQAELADLKRQIRTLRGKGMHETKKKRSELFKKSLEVLEKMRKSAARLDLQSEEKEYRSEILAAAESDISRIASEERGVATLMDGIDEWEEMDEVDSYSEELEKDPDASARDSTTAAGKEKRRSQAAVDPALLSKFLQLRDEHMRNLQLIESLQSQNEVQSNLLHAVAAREVSAYDVAKELDLDLDSEVEANENDNEKIMFASPPENDEREYNEDGDRIMEAKPYVEANNDEEVPEVNDENDETLNEEGKTSSSATARTRLDVARSLRSQREAKLKEDMKAELREELREEIKKTLHGTHKSFKDSGMFAWKKAEEKRRQDFLRTKPLGDLFIDQQHEDDVRRVQARRRAEKLRKMNRTAPTPDQVIEEAELIVPTKQSYASKRIAAYRKQKEDELREMLEYRFRAKEIPQSTLEPRYEMMVKSKEEHRAYENATRKERLQRTARPFKSIEEHEAEAARRREERMRLHRLEEEALFRAGPKLNKSEPPRHKLTWKEQEELEQKKRRERVERRSHELLKKSHLPSRMESAALESKQRQNSARKSRRRRRHPKVAPVPDFEDLHKSWNEDLRRRKEKARRDIETKKQQMKIFSFTTDQAADKIVQEKRRKRLEAKKMAESKREERRKRKERLRKEEIQTRSRMAAANAKRKAAMREAKRRARDEGSTSDSSY
eukprot:g4837.t1